MSRFQSLHKIMCVWAKSREGKLKKQNKQRKNSPWKENWETVCDFFQAKAKSNDIIKWEEFLPFCRNVHFLSLRV